MAVIEKILRGMIRGYQLLIMPVMPAGGCRFHPSCSAYAMDAIESHGAVRGGWLALKRICRCHPWGQSGFDPVPAADRDINIKTGETGESHPMGRIVG